MHFLQQLNRRQVGLAPGTWNHFAGSKPTYAFLPQSSFESLQVTDLYRFADSNDSFEAPPMGMQISGNRLAVANDTGDVAILDKNKMTEISKFKAHSSAIFDIKWRGLNEGDPSSAGAATTHILTGSGDRTIAFWDIERTDSAAYNIYQAHNGSVKSLSFYDQNMFASGGRDGSVKFWDLRTLGSARKVGPEFELINPHINSLPSVKNSHSVSVRRSLARKSRHSPSVPSSVKANFLPSNVVTCVAFEPTFNHHLYSCGINDSAIKVWDIRKCSRSYLCAQKPTPVKLYSVKEHSSVSTTSSTPTGVNGFTNITFQHSPMFGNVLLASATNSKIYSFVGESPNPAMIYSGRFSNNFTKISFLGDQYLLSGSSDSRAVIWRSDITLPTPSLDDPDLLLIEIRLPIYELQFDRREDISTVITDYTTHSVYNSSDTQFIFKWNFYLNSPLESERLRSKMDGQPIPTVFRYEANGSESSVVSLKRPSKWNTPSTSKRMGKTSLPLSSNITPSTSFMGKKPLGLITSYIYNCQTLDGGSQSEPPTKRLKTPHDAPHSPKVSQSTAKKSTTNKKSTRRNLFCNNRKISEFFHTP